MAIRRNQVPSLAIIGNQCQSVSLWVVLLPIAIERNQWQSVAISGNQWQSTHPRRQLRPPQSAPPCTERRANGHVDGEARRPAAPVGRGGWGRRGEHLHARKARQRRHLPRNRRALLPPIR